MTFEFLHNPHHLQSYCKLALQKRHYYHHRSHHKTQVEVRCPKQSGKERQCHVLHSLSLYFTVSQQVFQANTAPSCGGPEAHLTAGSYVPHEHLDQLRAIAALVANRQVTSV